MSTIDVLYRDVLIGMHQVGANLVPAGAGNEGCVVGGEEAGMGNEGCEFGSNPGDTIRIQALE